MALGSAHGVDEGNAFQTDDMSTAKSKTVSAHHFERDERLEAILQVRAESKIKFEMTYSFNDKRAAEKYAEAKRRAKATAPLSLTGNG